MQRITAVPGWRPTAGAGAGRPVTLQAAQRRGVKDLKELTRCFGQEDRKPTILKHILKYTSHVEIHSIC